jgi:fatty-acyl-CoA synthase
MRVLHFSAQVTAENIYAAIAQHGVTHLSGAPTVLGMLVNATPREKRPLPHPVAIITAGAAPPPTILAKIEEAGFKVGRRSCQF